MGVAETLERVVGADPAGVRFDAYDGSTAGPAEGPTVHICTPRALSYVATAKGDELPPGLLFIAYGDLSSRLMGGETHGSGMPTSKGIDVTLEVLRRHPSAD